MWMRRQPVHTRAIVSAPPTYAEVAPAYRDLIQEADQTPLAKSLDRLRRVRAANQFLRDISASLPVDIVPPPLTWPVGNPPPNVQAEIDAAVREGIRRCSLTPLTARWSSAGGPDWKIHWGITEVVYFSILTAWREAHG